MFVQLTDGREIPLEAHKVRIVQKTAARPGRRQA